MQIVISKAKNRLSQLIKSAQAGEEVIITNRGKPVARLVPIKKPAARELPRGNGKRIIEWLRKHPLPEYNRRSVEEIDAEIIALRNSRTIRFDGETQWVLFVRRAIPKYSEKSCLWG